MSGSWFAKFALTTVLGGLAMTSPVAAQTSPAFRVPLSVNGVEKSQNAAWAWMEDVGNCSSSCGTGSRTTAYICQDLSNFNPATGSFGAPEADSACISNVGSKPASKVEACTNFAGCEFDWVKPPEVVTVHPVGSNPVGRPGCGDVQREFDPSCRRTDGTAMAKGDHQFCLDDLPDYNDVANIVDGALGYDRRRIETNLCNNLDHDWKVGAWSYSSSTCSATAFKSRTVNCHRKFDDQLQSDAACAGPKPQSVRVEADYSTCSYGRGPNPTSWVWANQCSSTTTRSRTYSCQRSDGTIVANVECTNRGVS